MRSRLTTLLLLTVLVAGAAVAQDYRGVVVSTAYPSITTSNRDLIIMDLEVANYNMAPQRVNLSLLNVKSGWNYAFVGGGGLVEAVFASPDKPAKTQLWLAPPDDIAAGSYEFTVRVNGSFGRYDLPVTITYGDQLPSRLVLKPELPELNGTPTADFTYRAKLTNRSAGEELVNLRAELPEGFQITFKKKYENQELTSIPVAAGADINLEMKLSLPDEVSAGSYPLKIIAESGNTRAEAELTAVIKGQPRLTLTGPEGRMSDTAVAGKTRAINLTVKNTGVEDAENVSFRGSAPRNWELSFEPDKVDSIPAGESVDIVASITPGSEAITGDYNITMRANGDDVRTSGQFRITVRTSAWWGAVAIVVIALALAVVMLAIRRYGRR